MPSDFVKFENIWHLVLLDYCNQITLGLNCDNRLGELLSIINTWHDVMSLLSSLWRWSDDGWIVTSVTSLSLGARVVLCSISEGAEAGWCRAVQAGPRVTATIAVQSQVEPSPGGWTPEMGAGREGAIKPVYWFDSFLTIDFNKYRMFILKAFFEFCILFYFNRTCLRTLISINSLLQNQNLALHYSIILIPY